MEHKLKSILVNFLTNTFGRMLVIMRPAKAQELSEQGLTLVLTNNMSIPDRLMRGAILKKLENANDHDTLAELHRNYWAKKGKDFFSDTENRFENDFLPNLSFVFDILKEELSHQSIEFNTLVEIGTGNGNVLEYLSEKFTDIDHFTGIDLSPEQIELNNNRFRNQKKLEFIASDGFEWVKKYGQGNTIFVTSAGVLEYFTQPRLQEFFEKVNGLGKIIFVAIEPNGIEHDFEKNPNSQLYGHERSFSHNYPKLFKNAGFSLWHQSQKPCIERSHVLTFIGAKN